MRSLRAYLVSVVIGVALPFSMLSAVQAVISADRQRAAIEAGLMDTSRALAQSVEQELTQTISALKVLASSPRLASGDIAGFYEEARSVSSEQAWYTLWLADAKGGQAMNLLVPLGAPLPSLLDRPYFREALDTGQPVVSSLLVGRVSGQPNVAVVVPHLREGRPDYLIGVALSTAIFNRLLTPVDRELRTATASVVGSDFIVIARNRDANRWMGQRAHESYIRSLKLASEGLSRTRTLEGQEAYAAFNRIALGGWTVGMGVMASEVEEPLRRALWVSASMGGVVLLLATGSAVLISRRITGPIEALVASARGIASGHPATVPQPSDISEIATLSGALEYAAAASRERSELADQARHMSAQLEAAEIRERQQIARDLHDELSQTLSVVQIRLGRLQAHADRDVARTAQELGELVARANHSTRSLAEQLAPAVLYELGLLPALEWLAQALDRDYGLEVEVRDDGREKPLSGEAASIVFRCVRELLINVAKHAHTHAAAVILDASDGETLVIHVMDGGRGFKVPEGVLPGGGRLGLVAVRERLAYLGGSFSIRSVPGDGTEAVLHLPLTPSDVEEAHP